MNRDLWSRTFQSLLFDLTGTSFLHKSRCINPFFKRFSALHSKVRSKWTERRQYNGNLTVSSNFNYHSKRLTTSQINVFFFNYFSSFYFIIFRNNSFWTFHESTEQLSKGVRTVASVPDPNQIRMGRYHLVQYHVWYGSTSNFMGINNGCL